MNPPTPPRAAAALFLLAAAAPLAAQAPPQRALPAAVEHPASFTRIGSLRELSDGRVLVIDAQEKAVRLLDFARKTAAQVGRQGGGPGEYQSPARLLPLAGDTTLLTDPGLRRTIVILPSGRAGDVLLDAARLPAAPNGAATPVAVDSRSRLYLLGPSATFAAGVPTTLDSTPILRYDLRAAKLDSLGWVKLPQRDVKIDRQGTAIRGVNIRTFPLSPQDDWAVLPDGRVAIARTAEYRVDLLGGPGGPVRGQRVNVPPLPLSAEDRRLFPPDIPAPRSKPPFGPGALLAGTDGLLWVRRTTAAESDPARYDLFDASARLVRQVTLPPRTRVAGFGRGVIYLVRRDADDLEFLGRAPLPRE